MSSSSARKMHPSRAACIEIQVRWAWFGLSDVNELAERSSYPQSFLDLHSHSAQVSGVAECQKNPVILLEESTGKCARIRT
jgi:hypothetical protein